MTYQNHPRISSDPKVCHGKPVIAGTRVMVWQILGALAGGDSPETLLQDYPSLKPGDIEAALAFGAELAQLKDVPELVAK